MSTRMAIVMAAGKGTRMRSDLPKVLFPVCNRPMIEFVLDAIEAAEIERTVVVVGYRADDVQRTLAHRRGLEFVEQREQLGTGHAVMMCREALESQQGPVLIVTGDSPMAQPSSFRTLLDEFDRSNPACLLGTLHKEDPSGLGRIVRDGGGRFHGIVEEKDADAAIRAITEVNMSTYVFDAPELRWALDRISNENQQGEYYITDAPGLLSGAGKDVRAMPVLESCEALSINTTEELRIVEAEMVRMGYAVQPVDD